MFGGDVTGLSLVAFLLAQIATRRDETRKCVTNLTSELSHLFSILKGHFRAIRIFWKSLFIVADILSRLNFHDKIKFPPEKSKRSVDFSRVDGKTWRWEVRQAPPQDGTGDIARIPIFRAFFATLSLSCKGEREKRRIEWLSSEDADNPRSSCVSN